MPYINAVIAEGRPESVHRQLVAELSQVLVDVLDSAPHDIHVMIWTLPLDRLGENGAAAASADLTHNISMLLARGRSPAVLLALMARLTDVVQEVLDVPRHHVHVVLNEQDHTHIGEGGVPMPAPADPAWFAGGEAAPPRTKVCTPER